MLYNIRKLKLNWCTAESGKAPSINWVMEPCGSVNDEGLYIVTSAFLPHQFINQTICTCLDRFHAKIVRYREII